MQSIIFEDITSEYGYGTYVGLKVIIKKSNGYINASKLCAKFGKLLKNWLQNQANKELMKEIETAGIPAVSILKLGNSEINNIITGTYVHPLLITHIASWISAKVAIQVSKIVNEHEIQEYKNQLREKTEENKSLKEMVQDLKQQNDRLLAKADHIISQNEELKDDVDIANAKLDIVTDQRVVPLKNLRDEVFVVFRIGENYYYACRIQKLQRKSDGYINATKLVQFYNEQSGESKRLDNYMVNKSTKELIEALERELPGISGSTTYEGNTPYSGTFLHPDIALDLARWLSIEFRLKTNQILRRYYSGDLFLIRDIVQNYNATHEETKVTKVEVTITRKEELELRERELALQKGEMELIEKATAMLDLNDPREKIVAQSLKINAMNYLQRTHFPALTAGPSEEQKTIQELPALSIIVSSLVTVVNKGLKNSIREVIDSFTMQVSKAIAKKYRELYHKDPPKKFYMNSNGITVNCNLYTTEDEAMIKEIILNSVSRFNSENKFRIVLRRL